MARPAPKGDIARSEALVRGHLRLVALIGRRFRHRGLDTSDLIQEGNIGLIKASRRFDESRGIRFATYASWWIRQGMGRAVAEQGRTIRLPNHVNGVLREIAQTTHDLVCRLGRSPAAAEIAERMATTPERVETLLDLRGHLVSLDAPAARREDEVPLIDRVSLHASLNASLADRAPARSPEQELEERVLTGAVRDALGKLRAREREVLAMRFGIDGDPCSLHEVSTRLGLQVHEVRQIEQRALRKLRHEPALQSLIET